MRKGDIKNSKRIYNDPVRINRIVGTMCLGRVRYKSDVNDGIRTVRTIQKFEISLTNYTFVTQVVLIK